MSCFCPARVSTLVSTLAALPPLTALAPPLPGPLVAWAATALGPLPAAGMSAASDVTVAATANLSAMAGLSAALQAASDTPLTAALQACAQAATQAQLAAAVNSFNAQAGQWPPLLAALAPVQAGLAGLMPVVGLVSGLRSAYGVDLQAPGAVASLPARWAAGAALRTSSATAAAAQGGAVGTLLSGLGFKADVQGVAAAQAQASVLAGLMATVPAIGPGFTALGVLSAVTAMLAAVRAALGIDLLAAAAIPQLRAVLAALPLNALAGLPLPASLAADATARAGMTADAGSTMPGATAANVAAPLDLSGLAAADLSAAGPLAMLLGTLSRANLGAVAGSCGLPCPLVLSRFPLPYQA